MPKKNTENNDTDLAGRLDEVLSQDGPIPSYDSACSDGECSTGTASAPVTGADVDPRPCPKCGKPQSYQYNITHLPEGRSHWPGCLC